jgi:dTDP-L-rhamnose 4-epimerase
MHSRQQVFYAFRNGNQLSPQVQERILITGGAGFIGSHLADELLAQGYSIRALDNLVDQVHADGRPSYLDPEVELIAADVRDAEAVRRALRDVHAVVHFAARVGVGQSMYELAEYSSANTAGTAVLLETILDSPIRKLLVASSMSVYGEGSYQTVDREPFAATERTADQLAQGAWDPVDDHGRPLRPVATPETKQPALSSVYALTKYDQERLCLIFGAAYDIPTVAMRFFNTYGTRQALSNPYTGVLAIFASRLLNGKPPLVFEDGLQRRDFVAVGDVTRACRLALENDRANGQAINIGTGRGVSVLEVAERLARVLSVDVEAAVTGKFRVGDIRHCFADVTLARELLGFEAEIDVEQGIAELAEWLEGGIADDRSEHAAAELIARGLTR